MLSLRDPVLAANSVVAVSDVASCCCCCLLFLENKDLVHAKKPRRGVGPVVGVVSGPYGAVNGKTGGLGLVVEEEYSKTSYVVVGRTRVGHGV